MDVLFSTFNTYVKWQSKEKSLCEESVAETLLVSPPQGQQIRQWLRILRVLNIQPYPAPRNQGRNNVKTQILCEKSKTRGVPQGPARFVGSW